MSSSAENPVIDNPVIDIQQLQVRKGGNSICQVPELQIASGEQVAIVGDNGSGKTTLLRVLADLERDFDGQCRVGMPTLDRVFVHQTPCLFRGTVLFNAAYGLAARRVPRAERLAIAHQWLTTLGVDHLADRRCANLSGGERRRVALARAFALEPAMLLLDEPLADLDEQGIDIVCRAIGAVADATVLISSPVPLPEELVVRTFRLGDDE